MGKVTINRISGEPDLLGESPLWDGARGVLYWIDGRAQLIRRFNPSTGAFSEWTLPAHIGSIGLAAGHDLVVALEDGIYLFNLTNGALNPLARPPMGPHVRFNDGKVDQAGRFLSGMMDTRLEPSAELYRVDSAGRHEKLKGGFRVANSIAFSPDGMTMYFADTLEKSIGVYDYGDDPASFERPRHSIDTAEFVSGPDGATVDADGCLWVALIHAGKIGRFTPDGSLDRLIDAGTDFPSCVAFGGPGLATLFVTSIKDSGTGRTISKHPDGGCLHAIEGLGTHGLPEPTFGVAHRL